MGTLRKNSKMSNFSNHFIKNAFNEICFYFTKYKKFISISPNGHIFMRRTISLSGYIQGHINIYLYIFRIILSPPSPLSPSPLQMYYRIKPYYITLLTKWIKKQNSLFTVDIFLKINII